jgi:putative peptidoglycan binding protein
MGHYHTVQPGEHAARVATHYGFGDADTVWKHPHNAELRQQRGTPDVLQPGDQLYIPDRETRTVKGATEQRHRFTVTVQRARIRIVLENVLGEPLRSVPCELHIGKDTIPLTSNAHGIVEHQIPIAAEVAELVVRDAAAPDGVRRIPIFIGHLDPVTSVSGQAARLNNLGYAAGTGVGPDAELLRAAIEEFQCDHRLAVDGRCGPATQKKLVAVHGS